jgi:Protein of unknown function (DUF3592)
MEPVAIAITIIVVIALTGVPLIGMARRARRARERLHVHGVRVEGEVLDVWQDGMGSYCVRYRYTPRGSAQPVMRSEIAGCLRALLPEVGERVPVRYDPEAPARARLQREGC